MRYLLVAFLALIAAVSVFLFFVHPAQAQVISPARGGTGTSTIPAYGQVLLGQPNGTYAPVATSSLGISGTAAVSSVFGRTGPVTAQTGDYTTSQVTEGSNLYYTLARWAAALAGTTTDALSEGSNNLYFTPARALAQFVANLAATTSVSSITALPSLSLPYSQLTGTPVITTYLGTTTPWTTGALAQVSSNGSVNSIATSSLKINTGDLIEGANLFWTTTRFDNRLSATTSLPNITTLAGLSLPLPQTTGTLSVAHGGTGSTTLTGILKGNGTSALKSAVGNTDYQLPITLTTTGTSGASTFDGTTLNIPQYPGGGSSGLSSTTPWNIGDLVQVASNGTVKSVATSSLGLPTFGYPFPSDATTTHLSFNGNASTTGFTNSGQTWLSALATSAGAFIAVDPNGKVIATTTPTTSSTTSMLDETVTGSGTSFTLANTPIAGTVTLYGLGARLTPGPSADYVISGPNIVTADSWDAGDLTADYQK
jgi:hypothetical protein